MTDALGPVDPRVQKRQDFAALMGQVWLCFPRAGQLDRYQIDAYWRVLAAVPMVVLRAVAERVLSRRPAPEIVPSAPEWLEMANAVGAELAGQQRADLRALPLPKTEYFCDECLDTGFRPSRFQPAAVAPCECRKTNPVYQATRTTAPRYRLPRRNHAATPQAPAPDRRRLAGDDTDD